MLTREAKLHCLQKPNICDPVSLYDHRWFADHCWPPFSLQQRQAVHLSPSPWYTQLRYPTAPNHVTPMWPHHQSGRSEWVARSDQTKGQPHTTTEPWLQPLHYHPGSNQLSWPTCAAAPAHSWKCHQRHSNCLRCAPETPHGDPTLCAGCWPSHGPPTQGRGSRWPTDHCRSCEATSGGGTQIRWHHWGSVPTPVGQPHSNCARPSLSSKVRGTARTRASGHCKRSTSRILRSRGYKTELSPSPRPLVNQPKNQ